MTEWLRAFVSEPMSFLQQAFFRMVAILIGLCCHEWGHAYVAWRCGDDTAKKAGRMTLNPLAHLDPFGTLLMLFAGFGYAKPVPVNPNRFRGNRLRADLCVSLAGITVNTILFILFTYLSVLFSFILWDKKVIDYYGIATLVSYRYNAVWAVISGKAQELFGELIASRWALPVVRICAYTALINLNLAVFNLIPIPPLDGYHVVNDLLFKGRIHLDPMVFRIAMLMVLILSAQGIFGRIISAVVYPAQGLLLLPFGGT